MDYEDLSDHRDETYTGNWCTRCKQCVFVLFLFLSSRKMFRLHWYDSSLDAYNKHCKQVASDIIIIIEICLYSFKSVKYTVTDMLNKNNLAVKKCEANQKPQWL